MNGISMGNGPKNKLKIVASSCGQVEASGIVYVSTYPDDNLSV